MPKKIESVRKVKRSMKRSGSGPAPKKAESEAPKVPRYTDAFAKISPFLNGTAIIALRKAQIADLAKKTKLGVADISDLVDAHKIAEKTKLPPDAIYALSPKGKAVTPGELAEQPAASLRNKIVAGIKRNKVTADTLGRFDKTLPTLARLQANKTPLKTLNANYKLGISDSFIRKLNGKRITSLSKVLRAGGEAALAKKLKTSVDDKQLKTLVDHAHLSLLGSDVGINETLRQNGFNRITDIRNTPEYIFLNKVGNTIGNGLALDLKESADNLGKLFDNHVVGELVSGKDIEEVVGTGASPKCSCEDCSSAVSPLAYLADLMGYTAAKVGSLKEGLQPIYRLYHPTKVDHLFTENPDELMVAMNNGYLDEGIAFYVLADNDGTATELYRLFHPVQGNLYTTSAAERDNAVNNIVGYKYFGPLGWVYPNTSINSNYGSLTDIYRLVFSSLSVHHYTIDSKEKDVAVAGGWTYEGVTGCVPVEPFERIAAHNLEEMLHQPFNSLPTSCRLMNEQVRQVRICIEVLRSYAKANKIKISQNKKYLQDTYQALLLKLGTSYAALRAVRGASTEERNTFSESLGIPPGDGKGRDYVSELLLEIDTLSERDLERMFGLVDTERDPLSHGAKTKEGRDVGPVPRPGAVPVVTRWNFDGVSWNVNTDRDGRVDVLLNVVSGNTIVEIRVSGNFEARGEDTGEAIVCASLPVGKPSNKLTAELDVGTTLTGRFRAEFQLVPQFTSWRLQSLRKAWEQQDWLLDAYSPATSLADGRLPIIDPDLIGPDDFRDPFDNPKSPFQSIWVFRRNWLDKRLDALRAVGGDFDALFNEMRWTSYGKSKVPVPIEFWLTPADLQGLSEDLFENRNNPTSYKATVADLWNEYRLVPEALIRLLSLKKKHDDWVYDNKNPAVDDSEWSEVINILAQAHKQRWYAEWIDEESHWSEIGGAKGLVLGPHHFWIALREPKEGEWPPTPLAAGVPRLDPEIVKFEDLPDDTAGAEAISLWTTRRDHLLDVASRLLLFTRDLAGANKRILEVFRGLKINSIEAKFHELNGTDPGRTIAQDYVRTKLKWSVEAFTKVMELRERLKAGNRIAEAEWVEMERLLLSGYRQFRLWADWRKEEDKVPLPYWNALKARLPRWRASADARAAWIQSRKQRSQPPIVDPDLLRLGHFRDRRENPALELWRNRKPRKRRHTYDFKHNKAEYEVFLNGRLGPFPKRGLGASRSGFYKFISDAKAKQISSARLKQLAISREALDFLMRMHELSDKAGVQRITKDEWTEIANIFTQVEKTRNSALWREEEREKGITHSPDWFVIPTFVSTTQFPPPRPPEPRKWLGNRNDVQDWEDGLQSRIDQENATIDSVRQAVSEVEEQTLPILRDALILECGDGTDLSEKADWLTERLLLDFKQGGCEKVTRISLAITTIQQLLWGVRTGLLKKAYPNLQLLPRNRSESTAIVEFDQAMKWLGSLANYRAAMFVFLYPENIAIPGLKAHQSPPFKTLLDKLRLYQTLTPNQTNAIVTEYTEYIHDISSLSVHTCAQTSARIWGEEPERQDVIDRNVEFIFGLTNLHGRIYWSVLDLNAENDPQARDYAQSFWRRFDQLKETPKQTIGAVPYKTTGGKRYLYLFLITTKNGQDHLGYLKFDRDSGQWDPDVVYIEVKDVSHFTARVKATTENEPPVVEVSAAAGGQSGLVYELTFAPNGDLSDGRNPKYPKPLQWTDPGSFPVGNEADDYVGITTIGGGVAIAEYDSQQNIVVCWTDSPTPGHVVDYIRVGRNLVVSSAGVASVEEWVEGRGDILSNNTGSRQVFHNIIPVEYRSTCGSAIAISDLKNDRAQYLFHLQTKKSSDNNVTIFKGSYTVRSVAADGIVPAPETTRIEIPFNLSEKTTAVDIAILNDGVSKYLYVFYVVNGGAATDAFYRCARINQNGIWDESWSEEFKCPFVLPMQTPAAGIAISDLDGDSRPEMVVFFVENVDTPGNSENRGFMYLLSDLQSNGSFANVSPVQSVAGWFGSSTQGGSITVADINRNGKADVVVFHIDDPDDVNKGYIRVGFDLARDSFSPPGPCSHSDVIPQLQRVGNIDKLMSSRSFPGAAEAAIVANLNGRQSNLNYIEELFYFVPIHIGLKLQSMGDYLGALDFFKLVYDYTRPYPRTLSGLAKRKAKLNVYQRDDDATSSRDDYDWLLDPLNPHAIAQTRQGTYKKFTKLCVTKCLIEYAGDEFTQDSPETVKVARKLYKSALDLLEEPDLKPISETCEGVLGEIELMFGDRLAEVAPWISNVYIEDFSKAVGFRNAIKPVVKKYRGDDELPDKVKEVVDRFRGAPEKLERLDTVFGGAQREAGLRENAALSNKRFLGKVERGLPSVQKNIGNVFGNGLGDSGSGGLGPTEMLRAESKDDAFGAKQPKLETPLAWRSSNVSPSGDGVWVSVSNRFCVPQNPLLRMLRLKANLNLYKIRTCRNISGLKRELDFYAAATDTVTGLPSIGAGGKLEVPGANTIRPTPYRYEYLIERAKQLAQIAIQIEQSFLSTQEKSAAEAYAHLKAKQDLNIAKAGVRLQELRVTEAQGKVKLANLQRDRASIEINNYERWLAAGLNQREWDIITGYSVALSGQLGEIAAQTAFQAYDYGSRSFGGLVGTAILGGVGKTVAAIAQARININSIWAAQERREREWQFALAVAEQQWAIGNQEVYLAEDYVRVTEQERTIAQMHTDNAKEVVDFLANKFTNKELYDWMSGVLDGVYSFFLQQASSVANVGQIQLAFQLCERPLKLVQPDYLRTPHGSGGSDSSSASDRRGLTGAERLLKDIVQLEQYAIETKKRKSQLTKTISLAHLAPFEFQRFRETGILPFATPMELFDRDSPGDYLRLIKRVRTSVIALIPPLLGIRATLSSTGISRVVVGGDIFQKINLRRDPETLALSSPINATGMFDLEAQQPTEMLLTFENTGVDTQWEFRMLKASNPQIDYSTIQDVYLTIEYTALYSFDYYQQIIETPALNRPLSGDRPYSFRIDFADAWYDLHNPDQSSHPMEVTFETRREEFPPNLSNLTIQHVLLYVACTTDEIIELEDVDLSFTEKGGGAIHGATSTSGGVISTRRGNGGKWTGMIGKQPVGKWTLKLPDNQTVRELFSQKDPDPKKPAAKVADLLFVLTYSGRTPPWPM